MTRWFRRQSRLAPAAGRRVEKTISITELHHLRLRRVDAQYYAAAAIVSFSAAYIAMEFIIARRWLCRPIDTQTTVSREGGER